MRLSIGSDHRGFLLKRKLIEKLQALGHDVADEGAYDETSVDYPDIASCVGKKVSCGEADKGILICGTGIGMAISANKISGVRAATCLDETAIEMSRRHNDLNVLCLAGNTLDEPTAERLVELWLTTEFEGGRHQRRIEKIAGIEDSSGTC